MNVDANDEFTRLVDSHRRALQRYVMRRLADSDDSDDDDSDSETDPGVPGGAVVIDSGSSFERPRRRRAAGRPAGPPIHVD